MKAPPFGYRRAGSAEEAVAALTELGSEARILAGGQSLMPMLAIRLASPSHLVDIGRVGELNFTKSNGSVAIGAATTQWAVEHDAAVLRDAPLLVDAIGRAGQVPIRHRGTVAGSIAHADPSAEIPCAFLAQGGVVVAQNSAGTRSVSAEDWFQGPYMTALNEGELLREVQLDRWPSGTGHGFEEFSHSHESWPVVTAAVLIHLDGGTVDRAAIAMSGVGGQPMRAKGVEANLVGQEPTLEVLTSAAAEATADLQPFSDVFGSDKYRKKVAAVMVRRALSTAVANAGGAA